MALDFPTSPALNQTYTFGSYTWRWDGTSWVGAVPIVNATINNTTIGVTTPSVGNFTSIGATTQGTGAFTTLSATGAITGSLGATVRGYSVPASGSGMELFWDGTESIVQSYNRTGSSYQPLWLEGGTLVRIGLGGSQIAGFSSTGLAVTGSITGTSTAFIGTTSSFGGTVAQINGANIVQANGVGMVSIASSDAVAADKGGSLALGAKANGGGATNAYPMAVISGRAANTSDLSGYFAVAVSNSGGTIAEKFRIDSTGNVGIGTSSPTAWGSGGSLEVDGSGGGIVAVKHNGTSKGYIAGESDKFSINGRFANPIAFFTSGTERARIDSSGNLGVGTSSPKGRIDAVFGNTNPVGSNDVAIDALRLAGSGIAAISVRQYDSGGQPAAGDIQFLNLYFNGSTYNYYERARITAAGNLLVGTTSLSNRLSVVADSGQYVARLGVNGTGSQYFINFVIGENGTPTGVGSVTYNGTATLFNSTSDYRLKDVTGPLTNSGAFIDALKPKVGTWKSNGDKFVGFIAHEFAEVCPSAVTGEKDAVDSDGKPVYQAMQASTAEVIANLVAEIQQLRKRVAGLESK